MANSLLKEHLLKNDYFEVPHTPVFHTKLGPFEFILVVNDFGIKYVGKEHTQYLLDVLKAFMKLKRVGLVVYIVELRWTGTTTNIL